MNVHICSCEVPTILVKLKKKFSGHIFEKYSNMKFRENPYSGGRAKAERRKGGQA